MKTEKIIRFTSLYCLLSIFYACNTSAAIHERVTPKQTHRVFQDIFFGLYPQEKEIPRFFSIREGRCLSEKEICLANARDIDIVLESFHLEQAFFVSPDSQQYGFRLPNAAETKYACKRQQGLQKGDTIRFQIANKHKGYIIVKNTYPEKIRTDIHVFGNVR